MLISMILKFNLILLGVCLIYNFKAVFKYIETIKILKKQI